MIIFKNVMNQTIELSTENYQFPESKDTDYDGNWLQINIKIIEDKNVWTGSDPFLLTHDWMDISNWFDSISKYINPKLSELSFIEPNIEFQLINIEKEKDEIQFDIQLSYECIPNFNKGKKILKYRFIYNASDCKKISELCKVEYNRFPERKKR